MRKYYYSAITQATRKKNSKFTNRSRTYDLTQIDRTLYHWATGDSWTNSMREVVTFEPSYMSKAPTSLLVLSGRASDRCAGHRFVSCWENSEFFVRVACVTDYILPKPCVNVLRQRITLKGSDTHFSFIVLSAEMGRLANRYEFPALPTTSDSTVGNYSSSSSFVIDSSDAELRQRHVHQQRGPVGKNYSYS